MRSTPTLAGPGILLRTVVGSAWAFALAGAATLVVAGGAIGDGLFGAKGFTFIFIGLGADVVAYASVGALLVLRRPANRIGALLVAASLALCASFLGFFGGAWFSAAWGATNQVAGLMAVSGGLFINAALLLSGPVPALVFPDGHLPGDRWRLPVVGLAALAVTSSLRALVSPTPEGMAANPLGTVDAPWLATILDVADQLDLLVIPAFLLLAVAAVVVRYRRSRGPEREQLKWFIAALVSVAIAVTGAIADGATDPTVFDVLAIVSLSLPPVAIGIAVLRYRLYEIDRIISRTIGWSLTTGLVAAVFGVVIVGLQSLLAPFTRESTLIVAASTLVAAALSQPLYRRVQTIVDQRFNRSRLDAQRALERFGNELRDEVDLETVSGHLVGVASDTVRPRCVALWTRQAGRGR